MNTQKTLGIDMKVKKYLENCRELSQLTTQNGWIDNETLRINFSAQDKNTVVVDVYFDELIMEGSGCLADRVSCYGKVQLQLDDDKQVINMEIL